jgi:DNA ligase 4
LYGSSLDDAESALTRHLKTAFSERCDEYFTILRTRTNMPSVILDGEMIAWDPVNQAIIPFGNLKTAALAEKENTSSTDGNRPLCTQLLSAKSDIRYRLRHIIHQSDSIDALSSVRAP